MRSSDVSLEERLRRLRGKAPSDEPVPSDAEMMARVQAIRGGPPPRAAPSAGYLPPMQPTLSDAEAADELLRAATDSVRLAGGSTAGPRYDDATLSALAAGTSRATGKEDAPLVAPSKSELHSLAQDATAAMRTAMREMPPAEAGRSRTAGHATAVALMGMSDSDEDDEDDEAEAERLLEQLQDELVFEAKEEPGRQETKPGDAPSPLAVPAATPLFPSAPTHSVAAATPAATQRPTASTHALPKAPVTTSEDLEVWCCICTDDAKWYCADCDNDPYCARCWHEGHVEAEDLRDHRRVAVAGRRR